MLLNGVGEDSWESLGLQGDPTSPSERKLVLNIHWKDWCWSWNSNTLATWCEELTHWKRPWCWERLRAGEGGNRGWNGGMASPTQWSWLWVNSRSWWWTGKPSVLQSMGLQRVGHDWSDLAAAAACPLSRWCHPAISSSVVPFPSRLQSFLASGSFQMSQFFASCGQSIRVSASTSVLQTNFQDWFPLGWTGWISLQSKGLSRVLSNTTVQKHQVFSAELSL